MTEVALQTRALGNEVPAAAVPSRAWVFSNTAAGTSVVVDVVSQGKVLGTTTLGAGLPFAWRSVELKPTSQAEVDDLRIRFTLSMGSGCSNARAAYLELATEAAPPPPPPPGDVTPPETTISDGPTDTVRSGTLPLTFGASEELSTFECRLDGGSWFACASPYAPDVANGRHTFEVRGTDRSGNVDATPAVRTWWAAALLHNGTFESTLEGWQRVGYVVPGWKGSSGTIQQVAGGVRGSKARVMARGVGDYQSIYSYPRPVDAVKAGATYTFTGKVRSDRTGGQNICVTVRERDAGNAGPQVSRCITVGNDWTDLPELSYTPTVSGNQLEVSVGSGSAAGAAGEAFEVDQLVLRDGGPVTVPSQPAQPAGDPVLLATADAALCDTSGDEAVSRILDTQPGILAIAGDTEQNDGRAEEFAGCYDPTFGRFKHRTRPAIGDHEYRTPGAGPYWDYFGAAAGPRSKGWYSYDVGNWHVVVLNSNCEEIGGCGPGSEQYEWLVNDLATKGRDCTAAYFHHPLFSSGQLHGSQEHVRPFWDVLYANGVEMVWGGNEHFYERFARQTPDGAADPVHGVRQFGVGVGGAIHYKIGTPLPNSEVRESGTFGAVKFTLKPGGYDWQFLAQDGRSFTDSGSDTCSTTKPDLGAPEVALTAPADGATVTGPTELGASASDAGGIDRVEFRVDGATVATDTTAPYSVTWDSATVGDGDHAITARAVDAAGNATVSAARTVNVVNDTTGPTVALTAPADGATVGGTVAMAADAADPSGVTQVEFLVGTTVVGTDATAPYTASWNSAGTGGSVTMTARATDGAGNVATSAARTVTVVNDTAPPAVALTAPADGATVAGAVTLTADASDAASGVNRVEFLAGATVLGSDTTAPYSLAWDTTKGADGSVVLTARAVDGAGNTATSAARTVTVANGASSAPNLLANPGFETSTSGWSGYRGTVSRVAGGAEGAWSGRVTWGGAGTSYSIITSSRPIAPSPAGRAITAGAMMKAVAGKTVCLRVREWGPNGVVGYAQQCLTGTGAWVAMPTVRYTSLGGDGIDLYLFREGGLVAGESFDVDAISLSSSGGSNLQGVSTRTLDSGFRVAVTAPARSSLPLVARSGGEVVARGVAQPRARVATLRWTRAGRRALARTGALRVRIRGRGFRSLTTLRG